MRFLSVVLLFMPFRILACSCGTYFLDLPVKEMGLTITEAKRISDNSPIIFDGLLIEQDTFLNTERGYLQFKYTFKVERYYKGQEADTIIIFSNIGSSACGFDTKLNTKSIIFAQGSSEKGYYTWRSDCCKSIAKAFYPNRYQRYLKFLNVVTDKTDGEYIFYQSYAHFRFYDFYPADTSNCLALHFTIRNGQFEGAWKLMNVQKDILEQGNFKNGKRHGKWQVNTNKSRSGEQIKQVIKFRNGKAIDTKMEVIEYDYKSKITTIKYYKNDKLRKTKTVKL